MLAGVFVADGAAGSPNRPSAGQRSGPTHNDSAVLKRGMDRRGHCETAGRASGHKLADGLLQQVHISRQDLEVSRAMRSATSSGSPIQTGKLISYPILGVVRLGPMLRAAGVQTDPDYPH